MNYVYKYINSNKDKLIVEIYEVVLVYVWLLHTHTLTHIYTHIHNHTHTHKPRRVC